MSGSVEVVLERLLTTKAWSDRRIPNHIELENWARCDDQNNKSVVKRFRYRLATSNHLLLVVNDRTASPELSALVKLTATVKGG